MRSIIICILMAPLLVFGQSYSLKEITSGTPTSMRGLSVVSDEVAWVSGSGGHIGKTLDGGKTWEWQRPKGYEKLDFRDIEAFDANKAIVVNAGSPAYILLTTDGGKSWQEVYKNVHPDIFLDGMDFWDPINGIIFGDAIEGKMQLLRTNNGGLSWENISDNLKMPLAKGEAGFAASGTTIRTLPKGRTWIATGGLQSNIYYSKNYGKRWTKYPMTLAHGNESSGPFSIALWNKKKGIAVGGDYLQPQKNNDNVAITKDGGKTWTKPSGQVGGYRSGVAYLTETLLLATGTNGTDLSMDGGLTWKTIDNKVGNAVQRAKQGNLVLMVGNGGKIFQLVAN